MFSIFLWWSRGNNPIANQGSFPKPGSHANTRPPSPPFFPHSSCLLSRQPQIPHIVCNPSDDFRVDIAHISVENTRRYTGTARRTAIAKPLPTERTPPTAHPPRSSTWSGGAWGATPSPSGRPSRSPGTGRWGRWPPPGWRRPPRGTCCACGSRWPALRPSTTRQSTRGSPSGCANPPCRPSSCESRAFGCCLPCAVRCTF